MRKTVFGACAFGLGLTYACGADPLTRIETDAVITVSAPGVNYSRYDTYYLPERIVDLCVQPERGEPTIEALGGAGGGPAMDQRNCRSPDHSSDVAILRAVSENLNERGFERVSEDERENADVVVLAGLVSRASWSLSRPYCYPRDFYPGCVDQSANPAAALPYDALVIQIVDREASSGEDLESVWTAALHQIETINLELGTMSEGPSSTKSRIWTRAIDQAFAQTPQLGDQGGTE